MTTIKDLTMNVFSLSGIGAAVLLALAPLAPPAMATSGQPDNLVEQPALTDQEQAQLDWLEDTLSSLDARRGQIAIADGVVALDVPESFYFLDAEDSRTVLEDLWGNPPDEQVLGMLFPSDYGVLDDDAWGVVLYYSPEGHVDDDDAAAIDYDDLLENMRDDMRSANEARREQGYPAVELLGWAEEPHYDAASHQLYWAKNLRFEGIEGETLNYDIRQLGREGVLVMSFIAVPGALEEIRQRRDQVLQIARFSDGNRYDQFDPAYDDVAAYGLAGLIAGKAASKAGLLAAALLFLKKFWFLIVAAVWGGIKAIGGRGKRAD
ncbi:MAG: DUF2167 domain-containing protein [Alcanivoracaceae bacterium]|nr:DUF2167 domain-containing protein [Alcanivoracaceae bacterium]